MKYVSDRSSGNNLSEPSMESSIELYVRALRTSGILILLVKFSQLCCGGIIPVQHNPCMPTHVYPKTIFILGNVSNPITRIIRICKSSKNISPVNRLIIDAKHRPNYQIFDNLFLSFHSLSIPQYKFLFNYNF